MAQRERTESAVHSGGVNAWNIAQKAVDELPPYLEDDDLTPEKLFEQNKGHLSNKNDAQRVLDKLVEAGQLRMEERRTRKGGSPIKIYVPAAK